MSNMMKGLDSAMAARPGIAAATLVATGALGKTVYDMYYGPAGKLNVGQDGSVYLDKKTGELLQHVTNDATVIKGRMDKIEDAIAELQGRKRKQSGGWSSWS